MLIPLGRARRGLGSGGLPFYDLFAGHGAAEFFRGSLRITNILDEMHHISVRGRDAADGDDGGRLLRRLAVLYPAARPAGRAREAAGAALPVPAQQVVLRRALRSDLRAAGALARPPAVEGRRRLADRRLRPRRRVGARARRHPQRRAAADRLPLSLRLRDADRRRGAHHLVHVCRRGASDGELAHPLRRHLPAAARRAVHPDDARRGRRGQAQRALDRAVDHAHHLRRLARPGVALRSGLARVPVRREAALARRHASPTIWASTASRCRS